MSQDQDGEVGRSSYAVTGVATGQKAKKSSGRMNAREMMLMARP